MNDGQEAAVLGMPGWPDSDRDEVSGLWAYDQELRGDRTMAMKAIDHDRLGGCYCTEPMCYGVRSARACYRGGG
jgi:hypothetical protein